LHLAEVADATPEIVEQLGGGWVAEEALATALFCALKATNFAEGVLLAVNHSGDSDSTGSLTGNLLGPPCLASRRFARSGCRGSSKSPITSAS
jgi:ADP-ribosylglycohydrolase